MSDGPKIKDLETKLFVLAQGLRDEKEKSKDYLAKLKELEETLTKKDNDIALLTKAKQDLQASIALEKKTLKDTNQVKLNSVVNKLFTSDKVNFTEFDKMQDINAALRFENRALSKQCLENTEDLDQKKMKFATTLAEKEMEITKENGFKQYYLNKQKELEEKKKNGENLIKDFDTIEATYLNEIKKIDDNIDIKNSEIVKFMTSNEDRKKSILEPKNRKIIQMKEQVTQQCKMLDELKNKSEQSSLETVTFDRIDKIEGLMKKRKVNVTFEYNNKSGKYEMILTFIEESREPEIYDMSFTKGLNTKEKKLLYTYVEGSDDKVLTLEMDPLIVDYFGNVIEAYANHALSAFDQG